MSYFKEISLSMKTATGTLGALNAELCLENHTESMGTMVFQVTGTWKGKIVVEGAVDGTYNNLSIVQPSGTIAFTGVNNDNQNGVYRTLIIGGYTHVRLRMSSYTSGTATVIMNAAPLVSSPFVWQLTPSNLNGRMEVLGADGSTVATVEARKQTPTGNALNVQIGPGDPISNVPVTIEYDHHQVHEGEQHGYSNLTSSLASGSSKDFRINVPAALDTVYEAPHMVIEVMTTLEAEVYLYEGMTYTVGNGGTERTSYNRNRLASATVAATKIYEDPTPSGTGTNMWIGLTGSGNRTGGGNRSLTEWILKPGDYLVRVTSRAATNKVLIRFEWYEDLGV